LPKKRPRCVPHVRVGRSRAGFGLYATEPFKKGDYIAQYWGRRINEAQADASFSKYLFEINSRWTIDGSTRKNTARYINHSCRPNAEADVIGGKVIIKAIKKIAPEDEITYDYGKNYFKAFIGEKGCRCDKCREKRRAPRKAKKKKN
jgi:SET domain-containing protein